jgi:hypothetical protein
VTQTGVLCEFDERRQIHRWVDMRTSCATSVKCGSFKEYLYIVIFNTNECADTRYIYVACADAVVRYFDIHTLTYVTMLPRPHALGVDVTQGEYIVIH